MSQKVNPWIAAAVIGLVVILAALWLRTAGGGYANPEVVEKMIASTVIGGKPAPGTKTPSRPIGMPGGPAPMGPPSKSAAPSPAAPPAAQAPAPK